MATRKIEVNEDDLKKVILMLKFSKPFVKLDPTDLFLGNLWRVAPKLADKLMNTADLVLVENKGRKTLKLKSEVTEVPTEVVSKPEKTKESVKTESVEEKVEVPITEPAPASPVEEIPAEEKKVPRCRKRKNKK